MSSLSTMSGNRPVNGRRLVVLDMDGVVTSERGYWDAATCTLVEFLSGLRSARAVDAMAGALRDASTAREWLPRDVITAVKDRAINTNWDLAFLVVAWHLVDQLAGCPMQEIRDWSVQLGAEITPRIWLAWPGRVIEVRATQELAEEFWNDAGNRTGFELIAFVSAWAEQRLGVALPGLERSGSLWNYCFRLFQHWYQGTRLAVEGGWAFPGGVERSGIVFSEPLILPAERIRATLTELRNMGCGLAIGTGRTWRELEIPLRTHRLAEFFPRERIATHDEVASAESALRSKHPTLALSKPHPFGFLRAIYPESSVELLAMDFRSVCPNRDVIVVGDTVGDMRAGSAIDAINVAVLTGVAGVAGRERLIQAGATYVVSEISELPGLVQKIYATNDERRK